MAPGVLRLGLRFVPPPTATTSLFAAACGPLLLFATAPTTLLTTRGSLATTRAAGLIVAAALLPATTGLRLRLRLLRLRLSPLDPRLPALLFAASLFAGTLFAAALLPAAAPLFAAIRTLWPFVAPTALFGSFGAPLGMTAPAPLPMGFLVGVGDRDVGQGERAADRDRAALSASVSRAGRHVPARPRALRRAWERS